MRTALTIAGSDPSGGAGIQADLRTFAAFGVYGTSAVTAITVQNTLGVARIVALAPDLVEAQIDAVVTDFHVGATKIGMLGNAEIVAAVAHALARHRLPNVVLDPVMTSTSGATLLDAPAVEVVRETLLPLATIVTPNTAEAERLTGIAVVTKEDARRAAAALVGLGASAAVVTGGHLAGPAVDVLYDGVAFAELSAHRIASRHTHGTGCTFASALAAGLALDHSLLDAAQSAKRYVTLAIEHAPGLGHGRGPLGSGHGT